MFTSPNIILENISHILNLNLSKNPIQLFNQFPIMEIHNITSEILILATQEKEFCSAHLNLFIRATDGEVYLIYGKNAKHNNIASLGGLKDGEETVWKTLCREVTEETVGAICDPEKMIDVIKNSKSKLVITTSPKGKHWHFFVTTDEFQYQEILDRFDAIMTREKDNLPESWKENSNLVAIPVNELRHKINEAEHIEKGDEHIIVETTTGPEHFRSLCVRSMRIYLKSLEE